MRIVFVLAHADLGGGIRVVAEYARLLGRRGHEVVVVSAQPPRPSPRAVMRSLLRGHGWPEYAPGGPSHLDDPEIDHRVLDRCRPVTGSDLPDADIVIATWWETVEWVSRLAPSKGTKVHFVQGHETWGGPRERADAAYRTPIPKIVVSRFLRDVLRVEYSVEPVALIPNGVDTSRFDSPPRRKRAIPTVGMTYSRTHNKGSDVAIRAFQLAARRVPGLCLVAMGNDQPTDELPLPAGADFTLCATGHAVRDLYARCDVWLFASRREGFGLPVLEAMACRTPVIATPAGAAPDVLERGGGVLVAQEDAERMANEIERIVGLGDDSWRELSQAARSTALQFSWEASASMMEQTLLELRGERPLSAG